MTRDPQSKEAIVLQLLEEGDTTLCFDARYKGVDVPRQHAQNPALQLILNLNFPHPIDVSAEGIRANLAFGGRRHACYVPMGALWAAFNPQNMKGMMWPDSMPSEVQDNLMAEPEPSTHDTKTPPLNARQRPPRAVSNRQPQEQENETPVPPKRGHLRVVK